MGNMYPGVRSMNDLKSGAEFTTDGHHVYKIDTIVDGCVWARQTYPEDNEGELIRFTIKDVVDAMNPYNPITGALR